jgi:hypothetical protein
MTTYDITYPHCKSGSICNSQAQKRNRKLSKILIPEKLKEEKQRPSNHLLYDRKSSSMVLSCPTPTPQLPFSVKAHVSDDHQPKSLSLNLNI